MFKDIFKEIKDNLLIELKEEEFINNLKTFIIEPSICHVLEKLYPYIIIIVIVIILLLILLITILISIYSIKK